MGRNILVVEDDKNISDLIHMYLVKEGFDVRIAGDGGKALEEFQKKEPDLILLDIMLPVMDGWAVCAKIRETSKVPIIMLTAKSEVFDRIQGLEMGADDYIVKPFEMKELLPYIRFLKTDAAEAEILTGLTDRAEAAKVLYGWGAKEILITHNTEVLVYDGHEIYTCPIKARNLSGRTGRGDTTFAGYINERLTKDIPTALQTATALVSLKMETPGPFTGTRQDVEDYIKLMY